MLNASIIGNIGAQPDMKYTANGDGRLTFNVASNGRRRDQSGNYVDETTWVRVTVFGKRAESLQNLLAKGTRVYCDGRLEARPWTDQQGQIRAGLELMASSVEFMSSRQQDDQAGPRASVTDERRRPAGNDDDLEDAPF